MKGVATFPCRKTQKRLSATCCHLGSHRLTQSQLRFIDLSASLVATFMSPALSAVISQPGLISEITGAENVLVPGRLGPGIIQPTP